LYVEVSVPSQEIARGIDCASFYDFSIGYWKCSDSVVFFVFHFISAPVQLLYHYYQMCCVMKAWEYITNLSVNHIPLFWLLVG